jgi:hypothetical protein
MSGDAVSGEVLALVHFGMRSVRHRGSGRSFNVSMTDNRQTDRYRDVVLTSCHKDCAWVS